VSHQSLFSIFVGTDSEVRQRRFRQRQRQYVCSVESKMAETEAENTTLKARIEMLEKSVSSLFLGNLRQSRVHMQLERRIQMLKGCISRAWANDNRMAESSDVPLPDLGAR
jgi:uncharacterized protein YlxW (UPF0749 family)